MQSISSSGTVTTTCYSVSIQISKPLFVSAQDDWRLKSLETILQMAHLPKGLESWRLQRPESKVRINALRLIEALIDVRELHDIKAPFAVPTPSGNIQLEWANKHRELEIEILADGSLAFLKVENRSPVEEGSIGSVSYAALQPLFHWLISA